MDDCAIRITEPSEMCRDLSKSRTLTQPSAGSFSRFPPYRRILTILREMCSSFSLFASAVCLPPPLPCGGTASSTFSFSLAGEGGSLSPGFRLPKQPGVDTCGSTVRFVPYMLKPTKACQGLLNSVSFWNPPCAHRLVLEAACPEVSRPKSVMVEDCEKRFEPK